MRVFASDARWIGLALVTTVAVSMTGCEPKRIKVYPVSGKVLDANNKPAVGALVMLHPTGNDKVAPKAVGSVQEDGTFSLTTYVEKDGAAEGEYAITVSWIPPKKTPFEKELPDKAPAKFGKAESSPIPKFKVSPEGPNVVPTIIVK